MFKASVHVVLLYTTIYFWLYLGTVLHPFFFVFCTKLQENNNNNNNSYMRCIRNSVTLLLFIYWCRNTHVQIVFTCLAKLWHVLPAFVQKKCATKCDAPPTTPPGTLDILRVNRNTWTSEGACLSVRGTEQQQHRQFVCFCFFLLRGSTWVRPPRRPPPTHNPSLNPIPSHPIPSIVVGE